MQCNSMHQSSIYHVFFKGFLIKLSETGGRSVREGAGGGSKAILFLLPGVSGSCRSSK